jgi:hypothetical protein
MNRNQITAILDKCPSFVPEFVTVKDTRTKGNHSFGSYFVPKGTRLISTGYVGTYRSQPHNTHVELPMNAVRFVGYKQVA